MRALVLAAILDLAGAGLHGSDERWDGVALNAAAPSVIAVWNDTTVAVSRNDGRSWRRHAIAHVSSAAVMAGGMLALIADHELRVLDGRPSAGGSVTGRLFADASGLLVLGGESGRRGHLAVSSDGHLFRNYALPCVALEIGSIRFGHGRLTVECVDYDTGECPGDWARTQTVTLQLSDGRTHASSQSNVERKLAADGWAWGLDTACGPGGRNERLCVEPPDGAPRPVALGLSGGDVADDAPRALADDATLLVLGRRLFTLARGVAMPAGEAPPGVEVIALDGHGRPVGVFAGRLWRREAGGWLLMDPSRR
jgi:hypothetical protein